MKQWGMSKAQMQGLSLKLQIVPMLERITPWVLSAILTASLLVAVHRGRDWDSQNELYMHALPPAFNEHIVQRSCSSDFQTALTWMCSHFQNNGFGMPARISNQSGALNAHEFPAGASPFLTTCRLQPASAWYRTCQFALEIMLHDRIRRYQCLTDDPEQADMFYIPYYGGLDVSQYLYTNQVQLRDKLPRRLLGYLQANPFWNRREGQDHVLVLGRIVWDFTRSEEQVEKWGSTLLSLHEFRNVTKLLIERDVWSSSQIAVPYPTGFHPASPQELQAWLNQVAQSHRDFLVSFAGAPRKGNSSTAVIRNLLRSQCQQESSSCTVLRCEKLHCAVNPELVTCLALRSVFCLMPPGDSPTRRGFFDSLVSGCIPVVFSELTAQRQYLWHLPPDSSSYSVFFPEEGVINGSISVIQELLRFSPSRIRSLQQNTHLQERQQQQGRRAGRIRHHPSKSAVTKKP